MYKCHNCKVVFFLMITNTYHLRKVKLDLCLSLLLHVIGKIHFSITENVILNPVTELSIFVTDFAYIFSFSLLFKHLFFLSNYLTT